MICYDEIFLVLYVTTYVSQFYHFLISFMIHFQGMLAITACGLYSWLHDHNLRLVSVLLVTLLFSCRYHWCPVLYPRCFCYYTSHLFAIRVTMWQATWFHYCTSVTILLYNLLLQIGKQNMKDWSNSSFTKFWRDNCRELYII